MLDFNNMTVKNVVKYRPYWQLLGLL